MIFTIDRKLESALGSITANFLGISWLSVPAVWIPAHRQYGRGITRLYDPLWR
jgi:hypothetical protein